MRDSCACPSRCAKHSGIICEARGARPAGRTNESSTDSRGGGGGGRGGGGHRERRRGWESGVRTGQRGSGHAGQPR
eukprot:977637-Pyramimonas_sp.AAC.1